MKVLVFEYFNSGIYEQLPAANLVREGGMMRDALVNDLLLVDGIEVSVVQDMRLQRPQGPASVEKINSAKNFITQFTRLLSAADACWPIAPESDGILTQICALCERQNTCLLNTAAAAVELSADKYQTMQTLQSAGIDCVPTQFYIPPMHFDNDVVIKPNDGVGCESLCILQVGECNMQIPNSSYIVQPYLLGQAASLSLLCVGGEALLLAANTQEMQRQGQTLKLSACGVNMLDYDWNTLEDLSQRIAAAMPELAGYVGVDLIITDDRVSVLEVNPRLTTSYAGLHDSIGINPAKLVIDALQKQRLPAVLPARLPILVSVCGDVQKNVSFAGSETTGNETMDFCNTCK